jgi:hypothetical protein
LLTVNIKLGDGEINPVFWKFLLSGYGGELEVPENPSDFLEDKGWPTVYRNIYGMDKLGEPFEGICKHFLENIDEYREMYDTVEAHEAELPE